MKVEIKFYDGGYCYHPEFVALKKGRFSSVKFPALCAIVNHPQYGYILFDTGYSEHFYSATKKFPYNIYAKTTPVVINNIDKISYKIKKQNIELSEIKHIIISHFHADHIGGVKDFNDSKFIYTKKSFKQLKGKKGFAALRKGFLPELLPDDFQERSTFIDDKNLNKHHFLNDYFKKVYNVFDDQSIIGVELPGHAKGQLGIYVETINSSYFLVSDAFYLSKTYKTLNYPSEIVHLLNDSRSDYIDTIKRINKLHNNHKHIQIVSTHCGEKFIELVDDINWDTSDLNSC